MYERVYVCIIVVLSYIPVIASLIPIDSLRNQTAEFTLESLLLCAIASGVIYNHTHLSQLIPNSEFTEEINRMYSIQVWMRAHLILVMWLTVLISLVNRFRSEEKFDTNWFFGGFIGSLVMSNCFSSNLPDSKEIGPMPRTYHIFCAYLDVVAWIPQYKLTLKNERVDWRQISYIVGMFISDVLTIAGLTFQYQLIQLYYPMGFNAIVLKLIFFCGFIFKYLIKHCQDAFLSQAQPEAIQTNDIIEVLCASSEPCVPRSDGQILDNPISSIPDEVIISMDNSKLMIPA